MRFNSQLSTLNLPQPLNTKLSTFNCQIEDSTKLILNYKRQKPNHCHNIQCGLPYYKAKTVVNFGTDRFPKSMYLLDKNKKKRLQTTTE